VERIGVLDQHRILPGPVQAVVAVRIENCGGGIWFDIIALTPANIGTYSWDIDPLLFPIMNCEIRITTVQDPAVTDTSDFPFFIF